MSIRIAAVLTLAPMLALAALNTNEYRFACTLEGPEVLRTELVAAPFDAPLFQDSAAGFPDVRIVDDRGLEVPRAIEKASTSITRIVRQALETRAVGLKELPGNRIEAEFELIQTEPRQPPADGLEIRTSLRDFVRAVRIHGSADSATWQPLAPAAEIFDYHRYLDVRSTEVPLPANNCTRFRLEIGNASEERVQPLIKLVRQSGGQDSGAEIRTEELLHTPFRMEGVGFWHNRSVVDHQQEVRREWPLPGFTVERDLKERVTFLTIPAGKLPLNRLTLDVTEQNFNRTVSVQTPVVENGVSRWRETASGRLVSVDLPGYRKQELAIDFPEQRVEKFRLAIRDGDNPPLTVKTVTGSGPVYRALLLAEPGRSYRLIFGRDETPAPSYDLESVLAPARHGLTPKIWRIGTPQANTACRAGGRGLSAWVNSPAALTGVIVLAALVLLGVLARSVKHVSRKLDGEQHD